MNVLGSTKDELEDLKAKTKCIRYTVQYTDCVSMFVFLVKRQFVHFLLTSYYGFSYLYFYALLHF